MMRVRLILMAASACLASLGVFAGAFGFANGTLDQAIAFAWPGLGAALALIMVMPSRTQD